MGAALASLLPGGVAEYVAGPARYVQGLVLPLGPSEVWAAHAAGLRNNPACAQRPDPTSPGGGARANELPSVGPSHEVLHWRSNPNRREGD